MSRSTGRKATPTPVEMGQLRRDVTVWFTVWVPTGCPSSNERLAVVSSRLDRLLLK